MALALMAPDSRETQERVPARHVQRCHEERLCRTKGLRHPHWYSLFCLGFGPSSPITLAECPPKPGIQLPEFRDLRLLQRQGTWKYPHPPDFQEEGSAFSFSAKRAQTVEVDSFSLCRWKDELLSTPCTPGILSPLAYLCQPSEWKNFRAGRICLFSPTGNALFVRTNCLDNGMA